MPFLLLKSAFVSILIAFLLIIAGADTVYAGGIQNQNFSTPDSITSNEPATEIIEIFADSLNIGQKGENKIELIRHRVLEDYYVIVRFYQRWTKGWRLQNTYLYECNIWRDLDPEIADFNNDKFNDVLYFSDGRKRIKPDTQTFCLRLRKPGTDLHCEFGRVS